MFAGAFFMPKKGEKMEGESKQNDIVELGKETRFQSGEEAAEAGRKGGKRSGEVRRAKRDARQAAQKLLDMSASGKLKANLEEMGYKDDADGIKNVDVLVARLLLMSANGNLQAMDRLLKIAGYDSEEERKERESLNSDLRKNRESEARLQAMEAGTLGRYSTTVTDGDEGDEIEDVFIYLPDNGRDKDLLNTAEKTDSEEDEDLDDDGIPELEVEVADGTVPEE